MEKGDTLIYHGQESMLVAGKLLGWLCKILITYLHVPEGQ